VRDDGRGGGRVCLRARGGLAGNPHRFLAFFDLDFSDARFLEQLDQFLDFPDVHEPLP